jgi:NAD(P) transhydrogenase subunit beta
MTTGLNLIWLVAAVCFLVSLCGLARRETAGRTNWLAVVGMALAIAVCFWLGITAGVGLLIVVLAIGVVVGAFLAMRTEVTSMPQLTAFLVCLVSLAVVLVGLGVLCNGRSGDLPLDRANVLGVGDSLKDQTELLDSLILDLDQSGPVNVGEPIGVIQRLELFLAMFLGGLAFAGSLVVWARLNGKIASPPLIVPAWHWINFGLLVIAVLLGYWLLQTNSSTGMVSAMLLTVLVSLLLGAHLVLAIGEAKMSGVVSLLNSCVGFAVAAIGFALSNDLLIIAGGMVGSSGAVLAVSMSRAMNLSLASLVFGGFEMPNEDLFRESSIEKSGSHNPTHAGQVASMLEDAEQVVIVPGYGSAESDALHQLGEFVQRLKPFETRVRFAVHPVAGRMPGHMHALLAEAGVPYELVFEMDEINNDFDKTDLVLVVGANDIVNPDAQVDTGSSQNVLPVLEVWKANEVVVFRRSMEAGVLGASNPLLYLDNTQVLLGDAKNSVDEILGELKMH